MLLVWVALAGGCAPLAPIRVVILHTSDMHGQARPLAARWLDPVRKPLVGGLPALAAHIKRVRAEETARGARVLVVDTGDFFQGTPEGDLPKGRLVVDAMNAIGYDAACLGNHDFDQGPEVTAELARRARFPFLGANVLDRATGRNPPWLKSSLRFPDLKLEVLCLTTSEMRKVSLPRARRGLRFEREETVLERHGWSRAANGYARVLLAHVGTAREPQLARVARIDALLGGHSHARAATFVAGVPYLRSGSNASYVGRLELTIDPERGRVLSSSMRLDLVRPSEGEDPAVTAVLDRYAPEIDRVMNTVVGEFAVDLSRNHPGRSSPLGSYLCDLMREATKADVALHNRAGIRADIFTGPVRLRDVYQVSPFRNTLVTMTLRGSDLLALLARSVTEPRLLLEVSGLEMEYDGDKVLWVKVGGQPLDPDRDYRVVTNSFLANAGDGQVAFRRGRDVRDTRLSLLDLQITDLRKRSPRTYQAAVRIRPRSAAAESGSHPNGHVSTW